MDTTKPLQIFKPGRHTAMSGAALAFSETDLQASAAAYDPAKHEAPLVAGHPKHDDPAYGWVKSLGFAEGRLEAEPQQVDPAFAEMVAAGRFKKISASFYAPDSPSNPVPGVYYLRHVGFLGAQPPAVKGLRAPEFSEAEEGIVEFADWSDLQNGSALPQVSFAGLQGASLWRRMRDFLIAQFGLEKADSIVPDYAVASLEEEARKETADEPLAAPSFCSALPQASFADPQGTDPVIQPAKEASTVTPEQAAALEAENAQLKTKVADAEARDKAARIDVIHTGNAAFAESLVQAGKLLPVEQAVAVAALDHFATQESVVEFSEGDVKKPLGEGFKAFLGALPKRVEFGEIAKPEGATAVDHNDPTALAAAAVEFQEAEEKAGRSVSTAQAVAHITRK